MINRISLDKMIAKRFDAQLDSIRQDIITLRGQTNAALDNELRSTLVHLIYLIDDFDEFIQRAQRITEAVDSNVTTPHRMFKQRFYLATRIVREWLSLRPLIVQRLSIKPTKSTSVKAYSDHLVKYLHLADEMAEGWLGKPSRRFFVYFQKTYSISRFEYDQRIPSISIPLDVWRDPWHWMGIAHEIGHHVYWNSRKDIHGLIDTDQPIEFLLKTKIYEAFSTIVDKNITDKNPINTVWQQHSAMLELWDQWIEEIFADVFGALILGTAYVESLIAWMAPQLDSDNLFDTSDDHPSAFIRPLLQIAAIREQARRLDTSGMKGSTLESDLNQLETEWIEYVQALMRIAPENFGSQEFIVGSLPFDEIQKAINVTAAAVLDVLKQVNLFFPPYTVDVHDTVVKTAEELFNGESPKYDSALGLPIAWYAWSMKDSVEDSIRLWILKNDMPSDLKIGRKPSAKERPLIKTMIQNLKGAFPHDTDLDLGECVKDILNSAISENTLKVRYEKNLEEITDLISSLLVTEFSTEHDGGSCFRCLRVSCHYVTRPTKSLVNGVISCPKCRFYICS